MLQSEDLESDGTRYDNTDLYHTQNLTTSHFWLGMLLFQSYKVKQVFMKPTG